MAASINVWFRAEEIDTRLYLRVTTFQAADGLPRQEYETLGLVFLEPLTGTYTARVHMEDFIGYYSVKQAQDQVEALINNGRK